MMWTCAYFSSVLATGVDSSVSSVFWASAPFLGFLPVHQDICQQFSLPAPIVPEPDEKLNLPLGFFGDPSLAAVALVTLVGLFLGEAGLGRAPFPTFSRSLRLALPKFTRALSVLLKPANSASLP